MAWAIPQGWVAVILPRLAVTKLRKGGAHDYVFPPGASLQAPGENSPGMRDVRYVSVPGCGVKANVRLPL
jgi:hypothetical protein